MSLGLHRIRILALVWMPTEFFVAIDEAKYGSRPVLRFMGGAAALIAAAIFLEVFRSYREGE